VPVAPAHPRTVNFRYIDHHDSGPPETPPWELNKLQRVDAAVFDIGGETALSTLQELKATYPDKLALGYTNHWHGRRLRAKADGRDVLPFADTPPQFFLFYAGATLTQAVAPGAETICVSNAARFRKDDILQLRAGLADWSVTEGARVVGLASESTSCDGDALQIERAQYATDPPGGRAFLAGSTVAPHASTLNANAVRYNLSLHCPEVAGQRASDVMANLYAGLFEDELFQLDGMTFDVGLWFVHSRCANADDRGLDCDNDLQPDGCVIDNQNSFGLGVVQWLKLLRQAVGPQKILLADSNTSNGQRAYIHTNGFEAEGFPKFGNYDGFAGSFDQAKLWKEIESPYPRMAYLYTKDNTSVWNGTSTVLPEGWSHEAAGPNDYRFRVGAAAAALLGFYHAYSTEPDTLPHTAQHYEWDEHLGGALNQPGYLGRPKGRFERLTVQLGDPIAIPDGSFESGVAKWLVSTKKGASATGPTADPDARGGAVALRVDVSQVSSVAYPNPNARNVKLSFETLATLSEGEHTLSFWAKAAPLYDAPELTAGMKVGINKGPSNDFQLTRYWRQYFVPVQVPAGPAQKATLAIRIGEEAGAVWIDDVVLRPGGADLFFRQFDRGLVLLNMTTSPHTFALPNGPYRRLDGVLTPPPGPNDGATGLSSETVAARDARFLLRE